MVIDVFFCAFAQMTRTFTQKKPSVNCLPGTNICFPFTTHLLKLKTLQGNCRKNCKKKKKNEKKRRKTVAGFIYSRQKNVLNTKKGKTIFSVGSSVSDDGVGSISQRCCVRLCGLRPRCVMLRNAPFRLPILSDGHSRAFFVYGRLLYFTFQHLVKLK